MCSNEELSLRLKKVENCVEQNNRALRGTNGDGGIVQKINVMAVEVKSIKTTLESQISHLGELIETKMSFQEKKSVSWIEVAKSMILPIILSIITAYAVVSMVPSP
jgi:hypothetical protein